MKVPLENSAPDAVSNGTELKKILVVDDERFLEELVELQLQKNGYEHVSFNKPKKALAFFKKYHASIALAIIDLKMPAMSGVELATSMHDVVPDLPIILMTGTPEAKELGSTFTKVLTKPVLRSELIKAVREVIGCE